MSLQTWQPQTQSLQSVQVSIAIVMYPAAVSLHRDFHQLHCLPYNTMSAELLNFKTGWKSIHGRKLKKMQFFPVKNVILKENRDNTWSLHELPPRASVVSLQVLWLLPAVQKHACYDCELWGGASVKGTQFHTGSWDILLFHTVLTIPFPPVNRNP